MRLRVENGLRCLSHSSRRCGVFSSSLARNSNGLRYVSLKATPSTTSPSLSAGPSSSDSITGRSPDARFEVIGTPYSLLSASLSASQILYTRRGTLVGLTGNPDNAVSTLKLLQPLRRIFLSMPFLYQRITSTTPTTALIATKTANTSFAIVNLDGTVDWTVAQEDGLLAWTGHSLSVRPAMNNNLSLTSLGNTHVTGRGLLALVGKGQVYSIDLKVGEQFIAHQSNVVAYTINQTSPRPYRLKSSTWKLQVPNLGVGSYIANTNFIKTMKTASSWKHASAMFYRLRTWSRRTIWGDRLFLEFQGPTTLLLQSRGRRLTDRFNSVVEATYGDEPSQIPVQSQDTATSHTEKASGPTSAASKPARVMVANVHRDGKIDFQSADKKANS